MGCTRRTREIVVLSVVAALGGCSFDARFAQTASEPPVAGAPPVRNAGQGGAAPPVEDSGFAFDGGTGLQPPREVEPQPPRREPRPDIEVEMTPSCPASLAERLTVSTFEVGVPIRYKKFGYDWFPLDESVLLSVAPDGRAMLAVRENNGTFVRVLKLDAQLASNGRQLRVWGQDLGGLVAHEDTSFTLLTRRDDPGEPLLDTTMGDAYGKAAVLVRVRGTEELFARPLTGTSSITRTREPDARDCAPQLNGRLAWNGSKYGAYFAVHGCDGDPHEPYYGDKLVYVDGKGDYVDGGFSWKCSISQGLRLLPGPNAFTSLCMSDGAPFAGLNLVTEGVEPRQLAPERVETGYSAGQFGSVIQLPSGNFMVGWLSRGVPDDIARADRPNRAEKPARDIALLQLGPDYRTLAPRTWLTETPDVAEANLHLAPYGPRHVLAVWDNIESLRCDVRTCWGTYTGTSARLLDLQGKFATPDVRIDAPPNSEQDLVVFPNGDIGWAFVPDPNRNYDAPLQNDRGIPAVEPRQRLSMARLRYCE